MRVLVVRRAFPDHLKARLRPSPDRDLVPAVRVDGDAAASLLDEVPGERARSIRANAAAARRGQEEHVEPTGLAFVPCLDVSDRLPVELDDIGLRVRPRR